jgi:hypothetical protein
MNRWPPLVLVLAMVAGLVALDQRAVDNESSLPEPVAQAEGPVSAALDASGTTWYCPAGFITPDESNDHVVILTNATDEPASGTLTIYPSLLDVDGNALSFPRAVQPVEVPARSQRQIKLAPLVASLDPQLSTNTGAFVAALVEFEGAGVDVEHAVVAAQGSDIGPCATSASTSWWFASGTTTADVGYQLYLLNPFPDDAVVDISFVTDAGSRSPTAFKGKLVPAQSLTVLQVAPEVPVNAQMTAQVTVLTGRVIAERIQLFENQAGPSGLSLSLGSNRLAEQWFFPAGRSVPGAGESYLIYNPGDLAAEIEFEIKPDSADRVGDVAPLAVPVGPRERWIVTVSSHPSHPVDVLASIDASTMVGLGEPFFASIRSFNGVPVVAERILTRPLAAGGVTASLGSDVAATDQALALPTLFAVADIATLAVLNPAGDSIARIQVFVGGPDGEELRDEAEVAPRRRAVFDLMNLVEPGDQWIRVRSSTGTIAELTMATDGLLLSSTAIPVQGTTSIPDLLAFE